MGVHIIITGGTFDKHYDELRGELTFRDTHLPSILETVRCTVDRTWEINQLTDSLHMSDEERSSIIAACRHADSSRVVITHGTDTMTTTAALLGAEQMDKTIVLTGAMIPYTFTGSDAVFNLGCAVAAVQLLPSGVYIAMNGRVFPYDRVRKDTERGLFVDVE